MVAAFNCKYIFSVSLLQFSKEQKEYKNLEYQVYAAIRFEVNFLDSS